MNCLICDNNAADVSTNNRVLKYYCEDCKKVFVIHTFDKYDPKKQGLVMQLDASGKRFILRDMDKDIFHGVPVI